MKRNRSRTFGKRRVCSFGLPSLRASGPTIGAVTADGWLTRGRETTADDVGAVLRAWRQVSRRTQVEVAEALAMTQQHLSQMENGQRPVSIDQRRLMVTEWGIAAEDLGLSAGLDSKFYRADGASVFVKPGSERFATDTQLLGEGELRAAAVRRSTDPDRGAGG